MICRDYQTKFAPTLSQVRSAHSVSVDVDRLLSPKSPKELDVLENQILAKLHSNEPIDVEYWEQLLSNIAVYKAKAELNQVYKSIIGSRLATLRQQQASDAINMKGKLALLLTGSDELLTAIDGHSLTNETASTSIRSVPYSRCLDPEPLLKLRTEDKSCEVIEEMDFMKIIVSSDVFWGVFVLSKILGIGFGTPQDPQIGICTLTAISIREAISTLRCKINGTTCCSSHTVCPSS